MSTTTLHSCCGWNEHRVAEHDPRDTTPSWQLESSQRHDVTVLATMRYCSRKMRNGANERVSYQLLVFLIQLAILACVMRANEGQQGRYSDRHHTDLSKAMKISQHDSFMLNPILIPPLAIPFGQVGRAKIARLPRGRRRCTSDRWAYSSRTLPALRVHPVPIDAHARSDGGGSLSCYSIFRYTNLALQGRVRLALQTCWD